jgi:hypothetical protein
MKLNVNTRHRKIILLSAVVLLMAVLISVNIGPSQTPSNINNSLEISATPADNPLHTATSSNMPPESSTTETNQSLELPQITRGDITLRIESISAQDEKLLLSYKIDGLPANMFSPERMEAFNNTLDDEPQPDQIRLPDNTILPIVNGSTCEGAGDLSASWLTCYLTFPPLPENTTTFTLEIDRLNNSLPGEFPENWEIPITLPQDNKSTTLIDKPNLCSQEIQNINLCLLQTTQTAQKSTFNFGMNIKWQNEIAFPHHMSSITLTNAKGQYHILIGGGESGHHSVDEPNFATLPSLVTGPLNDSQPLTFHLDWVIMDINAPQTINFSPQPDAEIGQQWNLNQTIQFAEYTLTINKVSLKTKSDSEITYEFEIEMSDELTGLYMSSNAPTMSFEPIFDTERNVLLSRIKLSANPTDELEFYISDVFVKINGPWEITWQPSKVEFSEPYQTKIVPTRMAPESDSLQSGDPLLIELSDFIDQAYSKYNQPGWIVQKMQRESPESQTLVGSKDQTTTPPHIKIETWMHLNENGFIDTRITIIKTMDDEIFSINIDKDNIHFTLPDGLGGIGQDIYMEKPTFDLQTISLINGYLKENGQLTKTTTKLGSIDCLLYQATRPYNPPIEFSNHPQPVIEMSSLIWINPETGQILQNQSVITYEDGTSKITDTEYDISVETIQTLPPQIQTILDSIIIP